MAVSNSNFSQLPSIKLRSIEKQERKRKSSNITVTSLLTDKAENVLIAGKDNKGLIDCVPSLLMHLRRASKIDILKPPERLEIERWTTNVEIAIDRTITSCRFFAVLAVVGTLAGSVLCFVQGCFLMLESYVKCFLLRAVSHQLDHGMIQTAIEAIGTFFLVVTDALSLSEDEFDITCEDKTRASSGDATASRSARKIQECAFGDWIGSCLFCWSSFVLISFYVYLIKTLQHVVLPNLL